MPRRAARPRALALPQPPDAEPDDAAEREAEDDRHPELTAAAVVTAVAAEARRLLLGLGGLRGLGGRGWRGRRDDLARHLEVDRGVELLRLEVAAPVIGRERDVIGARLGVEVVRGSAVVLAHALALHPQGGAAVGLSRAVELGVKHIVMPSAGNAGGAWALYAARAGIDITVTMARTAPVANQKEVTIAGGKLELVDGTIADAGARAKQIAAATGAFLASTFNEPYRVEGKKTAWLETFLQLGGGASMRLPATIVLPVGGGVAAVAAAKAAAEVTSRGWVSEGSDSLRLVGVQSEDCAPIVRAFERGESHVDAWTGEPSTIAAGLRVPVPSEGDLVLDRVRSSGGTMLAVSEDAIRVAVGDLAATEGLLACPEGAATVPAVARLASEGDLEGPVVLYNTGSGIKYLAELDFFASRAR